MSVRNNDTKYPVALVGGGAIAPFHAKYLTTSTSCVLVAIVDPFPPGLKLAKELSIPHFLSLQELLSSNCPKPDAYVICVPSGLHVSVALDVLSQATPKVLLVEKPFATDSKSGAKLIAAAQEKEVSILVGHHRRFNPYLEAAKETITAGRLGKITAISGLWTVKKNDDYFDAAKWRTSRSGGGGPVWINMVHEIDALHYLMGSNITRVWVIETDKGRLQDAIDAGDGVEEGAAILLQFASGVVGTFIICDNVASPYNWEHATGENPLLPKVTEPVDSYRIFGTKGTITVPDNILWTYQNSSSQLRASEIGWNLPITRQVVEVGNGIPFQRQAEHLGKLIAREEEPRCSGNDGLAAVKVCEAIIDALRVGDGQPHTISHD